VHWAKGSTGQGMVMVVFGGAAAACGAAAWFWCAFLTGIARMLATASTSAQASFKLACALVFSHDHEVMAAHVQGVRWREG
jgi:hypothetical protein